MPEILSYGGGVQTVAMCVLVATGRLPRPDAVIAADTGREMPTTWQYAREHAAPLLARVGLDLHIAPHDLSTLDLHSSLGDLLIPAFTPTGKLPTFCSEHWKRRVVERYAQRVLGFSGAMRSQIHWIGFSLEERGRVKGEDGRRYPLLDLMLTREDCAAIITGAGLPLPHKSRCYICPHQSPDEWLEVREDAALWSMATEVDDEVRDADERGGVWLHESRRPLRDLSRDDLLSQRQRTPNRQCGLGMCFV